MVSKLAFEAKSLSSNLNIPVIVYKGAYMSYLSDNYPTVDCDENGNVYRNGKLIHPFKSNGYRQIIIFDKNGNKRTCGVHTIVAMKYLDYYEGCNVHHIDHNRQNNCLANLKVYSKKAHCRHHAYESNFINSQKGKIPWNKGIKMSESFCKKCSDSAKKRGFVGNQFIDRYGNER